MVHLQAVVRVQVVQGVLKLAQQEQLMKVMLVETQVLYLVGVAVAVVVLAR